jgi:ankyrin repeat protein
VYSADKHFGGVTGGGYESLWIGECVFLDKDQISILPFEGTAEVRIDWKRPLKEVPIDIPAILTSRKVFMEWFRDGTVYVEFMDREGNYSNMLRVDTTTFLDFAKVPEGGPLNLTESEAKSQVYPQKIPDELFWAGLLGRAGQVKAALAEDESVAQRRFRREETLLHQVARGGHRPLAITLIDHGADPNAQDMWGDTPLHKAARSGHKPLVRLLVERGAKPDSRAKDGRRPLHNAAIEGHDEIIRVLLDLGADNEASTAYGTTPLHCCARRGHVMAMRILVEEGASVDAKDNGGYTPLALAVKHGYEEMVKYLIKEGADTGWTGETGKGLVEIARFEGHDEIAKYIERRSQSPKR